MLALIANAGFAASDPKLVPSSVVRPPSSVLNPRFTGTPFLRTWGPEDYAASAGNQCVIQHPYTGFIYVGNNGGVLEFDGARWRTVRFPNRPVVRTLAVDGRGRVWAANDDTIACLLPDARGDVQAQPMMDRLPAAERAFRGAFASLTAPGGVYFAATQRLFFFADDGATTRVWNVPDDTPPLHLWWEDDAPHLQYLSKQTYRLSGDAVIRLSAPTSTAALLASVRTRGDEGALCLSRLADGRVAFGTALEGLVIRDADGRVQQRIDRAHGLPSNRVEGLCEDAGGGVWLALRNGLARVQLGSPYALHGHNQDFDGTPTHLALYHGDLYVSGTEGLARRDADGRFHFLENFVHVARELVVHDDELFVTGRDLQIVLPGDRVAMAAARAHQGFVALRTAPNVFVRGSQIGLWILRRQGSNWTTGERWQKSSTSFHVLVQEPAGVVWAVAPPDTLWRVDFRRGAEANAPAQSFGAAQGLPNGMNELNLRVFRLGSGIDALVRGRLVRLDEAAQRFIPEARIRWSEATRELEETSDGGSGGNPAIAVLHADESGTPWVQVAGPSRQIFRILPDDSVTAGTSRGQAEHWRAEPVAGPALTRFSATTLLHDAPAHTLWVAGPATLISQDLDWQRVRPISPLSAAIRRVETLEGTVLWADGNQAGPSRSAAALPRSLPPGQRALRVVFASPAFECDYTGRTHTMYRTKLDGLEPNWTRWSAAISRDFTNLPYRGFTFHVQARDDSGRTSTETTLAFSVAPPWWLTNVALLAVVLLAIAAVAAVARHVAQRALRRRVQLLEAQAAIEAERLRLARDMHDDLGSGLGRVALLGSSVLAKLDDRGAVEAHVRKITETAQALSRATRDIIWAVNPQNETVPELVDHLARLSEETLGEAGIRCTVDIASDLPAVTLGAAARHAVLLALKEALHNAVKYSEAKTAEVSVRTGNHMLVLTLRDHGHGFAPGECRGTGHGLKSIAARLEAHGGAGEVTSAPGQGTTVRLKLPLLTA